MQTKKTTENKQINSFKSIGKSIKMMWSLDKPVLIVSILISIIEAILPYIGILLSAYVLDVLTAKESIKNLIITAVIVVFCIFILTVTKSYLIKIRDVHVEICRRKFDMKMNERTLTMDYELLDSPQVNDIKTRIRTDNMWGSGFSSMIWMMPWVLSSLVSLITSIIILIPLFSNVFIFTDVFAIIMILAFFAVIIFNTMFSSKMGKKINNLIDDSHFVSKYMSYFMWSTDYKIGKDIRIFNAKKIIQEYMSNGDDVSRKWVSNMTNCTSVSGFSNGLTSGLLQGGAYLFVVLRAISGMLSVGAVLKYATTIFKFSSDLSNVLSSFAQYSIAANRQLSTLEYMNIPDTLYKGSLTVEKRVDNDYEIEFKNVWFKYPGTEKYALKNLNLKFNIGQKMAVVGMNGSGKTTMIKLLCRLYDPSKGSITLNGIDIKKYDYGEYMGIFSVVFQDFKLFSFSVGENVATNEIFDEERARMVLEKAGLSNRLSRLPKGLNTALYQDFEEDGVEVSGGEAQKIAIARALYKDAPFIVLDEPTAALDPIAEFEIYSKFNEIVADKTAIYISHRLSSCRFCDNIAVFDNGELVQRGNHEVLISEENGKYFELWNAQAQYYEET